MANEFKIKNGIKFPDNSIQTSAASGGSSIWFGDTAPSNPTAYPIWFDTRNPETTVGGLTAYVYFTDANSSQWVPLNSFLNNTITTAQQAGLDNATVLFATQFGAL
jgi:hypothetical protein